MCKGMRVDGGVEKRHEKWIFVPPSALSVLILD
jgi:hypothetical protein